MKTTTFTSLKMKTLAAMALLLVSAHASAQVFSSGGGDSTDYKSTIGYQNMATGKYSLAAGYHNTAASQSSIALGHLSKAEGLCSVAIGMYTHSQYHHGITIGRGYSNNKPLLNNTDGIMFGTGSNLPTLFISEMNAENYTGKVGIGNVTDPQAKLHIRGDALEDADILLVSYAPFKSAIRFRNDDNSISLEPNNVMRIKALTTYLMIDAPKVCFGSATTFLSNTNNEVFSIKAPNAIAQEAGTINLTASNNIQMTGKVGINTTNTTADYALAVDGGLLSIGQFKAISEDTVRIVAKEGIQSKPILLNGLVGINTERIPNTYVLAVNGGIIAEKVMIKYHTQWPDYVFESDYKLMPMHDLRTFVTQNKHLPEVPSAAEIENGLDVGQLQGVLLKKIEELTLYTLQLQEQVERQQAEIEELKSRMQ